MNERRGFIPTQHDEYLFDVQGFLLIKHALTRDEVARINMALDEHADELQVARQPVRGHTLHPRSRFLLWSEELRALMDHPSVFPCLERWVEPGLRLDHCYGLFSDPSDAQFPLHHGGTPWLYFAHYESRDGRIYAGPTVVSWALSDQLPGSGGFSCIPGSHKAALPLAHNVRRFDRWEGVVEIGMEAGDALIFTEALAHGSPIWTHNAARRTLLFKYSPGCLAWSNEVWPDHFLALLTPRQRRLCRAAFAQDVTVQGHGFRCSVSDPNRVPILEESAS